MKAESSCQPQSTSNGGRVSGVTDYSKPQARQLAGTVSIVSGQEYASSVATRSVSLSSPKGGEGRGEEAVISSNSPRSNSRPTRSSRGERGKTLLAFFRPDTIGAVCVLALLAQTQTGLAERVVLVAGGGTAASGQPATACKLNTPFGVDFDRAGNLFIVEMAGGERVLKVDADGRLTVFAGTGEKGFSGDAGPALKARFNGLHSLAVAPNGDVYLADTWNNRVRKIDGQSGLISTVVGTGQKSFSGDHGPAVEAGFGNIYCASLDPQGKKLFLADLDNRRIRAVDLKSGVVTTVAGNGQKGVPPDGAVAVEAPLVDPRAVAADEQGNVYVLERGGHALRVVDLSGKIRTVVNASGKKGASGDGGDARQATLSGPKHLCIDREGNVIIADTDNHVIRKYLPREGKIVLVAGTGKNGAGGIGGPPEQVELNQPHGVTMHRDGTLYLTDSYNHRILKLVR